MSVALPPWWDEVREALRESWRELADTDRELDALRRVPFAVLFARQDFIDRDEAQRRNLKLEEEMAYIERSSRGEHDG